MISAPMPARTDPTGWTSWPAPAKLNLFLRITGRRADGYHRLQTAMQLLDWGDTIHILPGDMGAIERAGGDTQDIPEQDDLLIKAANLLRSTANVGNSAIIRAEKRIPRGGGFGGGSSNAATVLLALNRLWNTRMDLQQLEAIGLQLGADVPFFVRGHCAWAQGIGEQLQPLALPPAWFLLVDPGVHVATASMFNHPELTRDAAPATIADFVSGAALGNVFEPVLRRLQPAVDVAMTQLSRFGTARLTGTGSGCFLQFDSQAAACAAQSGLTGALSARSWVVEGISESPLRVALEAFQATG